jgi:hypothetical protein
MNLLDHRPRAGGPQTERAIDDPLRPPFAAGHPVTWGAITDGTTQDGVPFIWRDPLGAAWPG